MAHLHCLYYRGALKRHTGADGVIRFQQDGSLDEKPAAK